MKVAIMIGLAALALPGVHAVAQSDERFAGAEESARRDLEAAREGLVSRRREIAGERLELEARLSRLSREVEELRKEWGVKARLRDDADVRLESLRDERSRLREVRSAAWGLVTEIRRGVGAQLSVVDAAAYARRFGEADLRLEKREDLAVTATAVLDFLCEHAEEASRIRRWEGKALAPDGREYAGAFLALGDALTYFAAESGDRATGFVTTVHGSPRPQVVTDLDPGAAAAIADAVSGREAVIPIDVTGGAALRERRSRPSLWEQFQAGGVVMWPILAIFVLGAAVGIMKFVQLLRIRADFDRPLDRLLEHLKAGSPEDAAAWARSARSPVGALLVAAVDHRDSSRGEMEEALAEAVLGEGPAVEAYVSVLAVGAAVAPLLGLLGTVTGMIHTFRLISVFGTGDPQLLSSGISEALVTTEAGLVVAIPLLLLHAFLTRRTRRITEGLEAAAIRFLNRFKPEGGER